MLGLSIAGVTGAMAVLQAGPTAVGAQSGLALRRVGIEMQRFIQVEELSGQLLNVRSGRGRRATFYRLKEVENNGAYEMSVSIGSNLGDAPYMRAQDQGATIVPVRGQFLTIPLAAVLTGKGVARFTAAQLRMNPEAFGYTSTFIAKGVIFGRRDEGGRSLPGSFSPLQRRGRAGGTSESVIVPLFALKRSVRLRPVNYLKNALQQRASWIGQQFDIAAETAVRQLAQMP